MSTDSLPPRSLRAVEQLRLVSGLPGSVIELGVYRGTTTIALARYLKENSIKKKIYACDTFSGLPYDGKEGIDPMLKKGESSSPYEVFWDNVVKNKVEEYIIPVHGRIEDTLYTKLPDEVYCLAFLDLDLYESTSFATRYLMPRIVLGGVMGFHDYRFEGCPGIEIVVDKEIDYSKFRMYGDHWGNCAWLQKVL